MNPGQRFALIIAVDQFQHPRYSSLPGAAKDGMRVMEYAQDLQRGCFGNVELLANPTKAAVEEALTTLLSRAEQADGMALVYFATHGVTRDRYGLSLLPSDGDPDRLTATAISVSLLAQYVAEHSPKATIFLFDVCQAGGHLAGAADLALDLQWGEAIRRTVAMPDGHFLLGACGMNESAREDHRGGVFTSLLIDTLALVGQTHPHLEEIPIELVASAVVEAAHSHPSGQNPSWSGIAISSQVAFGRNPFHSTVHPSPTHHVDLRDLTQSERQQLSEPLRQHLGTLALIGGEKPWSSLGLDVVDALGKASAVPEAKVTFLVRAAEAAQRRLPNPATPTDLREFFLYLEGSIVALARYGGSIRTIPLVNLAAALVDAVVTDTRRWVDKRGWIADLGPAAAGLSPILFWDQLGRCSFVALACHAVGRGAEARQLEQLIIETLAAHPLLHRVSWAGQYPDIAVTLGIILRHDLQIANACVKRLIARLVSDTKAGLRPIEAEVRGADLGKLLARQLLNAGPVVNQTADEAPPFLVLLLQLSGATQIELNAEAAKLLEGPALGLWILYSPGDLADQYERWMLNATSHSWVRYESMNAIAQMLEFIEANSHWPYDISSASLRLDLVAGTAAGRVFRNRAGFGLPAAIVSSS